MTNVSHCILYSYYSYIGNNGVILNTSHKKLNCVIKIRIVKNVQLACYRKKNNCIRVYNYDGEGVNCQHTTFYCGDQLSQMQNSLEHRHLMNMSIMSKNISKFKLNLNLFYF